MTGIEDYIMPELLVLVPVLYALGMAFKKSESIADKHIPVLLGVVSVVLSCVYVFGMEGISTESVFTAMVQGILCASASVYANQTYRQETKE